MRHAAIFDLDGTLIDTPNAIVTMMGTALKDMGIDPPADAVIRATIGLPLETGAGRILGKPEDDPAVAQLITLYRRQFLDWMVPQAGDLLFPGVKDGLAFLKEKGIKLGVATSKYHRSAEAVLRSAGLWELFSAVAGSDSVVRQKPDAEMAQFVAARLDCPPQRCAVIGDTVHDLRMGRSAAMRTLAVSYGVGHLDDLKAETPDWIANDFSKVAAILHAFSNARKTAA